MGVIVLHVMDFFNISNLFHILQQVLYRPGALDINVHISHSEAFSLVIQTMSIIDFTPWVVHSKEVLQIIRYIPLIGGLEGDG